MSMRAGGRGRVWPEAPGNGMTLLGRAIAARLQPRADLEGIVELGRADVGASGWRLLDEDDLDAESHRRPLSTLAARMKHCGGPRASSAETLEDVGAKGWVRESRGAL